MKYASVSVLLLAALAFGHTWVVEQVDSTAASGSPVELVKASDGSLWTCYQTDSGFVRVACLGDSGWSMTDVVPGDLEGLWRPSMAASPHGELCLSCRTQSPDSGWLYRLIGDTWHAEPYPFITPRLCGSIAYDTAGRLHTAFNQSGSDFWAGHETDSGWTAGLAVSLFGTGSYVLDLACFTVAADGGPWYFAYLYWWWSQIVWGEETALMHFSGDTWDTVWDKSGQGMPIPLALVPHSDSVGWVSVGNGVLLCDSETVDSVSENSVAGLTYTIEDVPLVTWVPRYSSAAPVFAFKTDRWRTENIPGPDGVGGIDVEVGENGQVFIVYSTEDSGLWCARGTDVVGVEEGHKLPASSRRLAATIIRSLPAGAVAFDAMGRRVVTPRSGVFFVREAQAQAVRKVVVQH